MLIPDSSRGSDRHVPGRKAHAFSLRIDHRAGRFERDDTPQGSRSSYEGQMGVAWASLLRNPQPPRTFSRARPGHAHCPAAHRRPTAIRTGRTAPGCSRRNHGLPRIPQIDRLPLAARGSGTGRRPRSCRPSGTECPPPAPAPAAPAGPARGRQHLDHLIQVAVRGGLRQPEPAASRGMCPCPGTRPGEHAAYSSPACGFPSACRSRAGAQRAGGKRTRSAPWARRACTIGDHAEPLPVAGCSLADSSTGAPRLPGDLRECPRVCPYVCYITLPDSRLLGKRHHRSAFSGMNSAIHLPQTRHRKRERARMVIRTI